MTVGSAWLNATSIRRERSSCAVARVGLCRFLGVRILGCVL